MRGVRPTLINERVLGRWNDLGALCQEGSHWAGSWSSLPEALILDDLPGERNKPRNSGQPDHQRNEEDSRSAEGEES